MNDDFLKQFQKKPRPQFAKSLYERLQAQDEPPVDSAPQAPLNGRTSQPSHPAKQDNEDNDMNTTLNLQAQQLRPGPLRLRRWMVLATAALVVVVGGLLALNASQRNDGKLSVALIRPMADMNRDTFQRYINEAWNGGNVAVLPDLLTADYVRHETMLPEDVTGLEAVAQTIEGFHGMPDITVTVDEMIATETQVWARLTITGKRTGTLRLADGTRIPATGNSLNVSLAHTSRFDGARMAKSWVEWDRVDFLQQLDLLPAVQQLSTEEENIEVVRQFAGLFNNPDVTAEDVRTFFATATIPSHGLTTNGRVTHRSAESLSNLIRWSYGIYPDFASEVENIVAQDDLVIVQVKTSGTFTAAMGTGNVITPCCTLEPDNELHEWELLFMYRLEDGKIAEEWWFWNSEYVAAHTR